MKFILDTAFSTPASSESLWILVDSEQLQQNLQTYQINHLENILTASQFKAGFNENLPLIANINEHLHAQLLGLGKSNELKAIKLAKLAQSIIKSSQTKFKQIMPLQSHLNFLDYASIRLCPRCRQLKATRKRILLEEKSSCVTQADR